jgi:hypothetical protein
MRFQENSDVLNSQFIQPSMAAGKRSLAVRCANAQCSRELIYLREGTLKLLEMESHSGDEVLPDDGSFQMRSLPSKYFWLCGKCAAKYIVKRWTISGTVLASLQ